MIHEKPQNDRDNNLQPDKLILIKTGLNFKAVDLSQFGGISVIPLSMASIASLSIMLERGYFWYKTKRGQNSLKRKLLEHCFVDEDHSIQLRAKERDHIMTKFFQRATIPSPSNLEQLRDSCELHLEILEPELSRHENILGTIISIAPLIGLLGTVLGLIQSMSGLTLQAISESNTNVMAGISEALISTAAGLTIAITTLIANNLFKSFRRSQLHTLQAVSMEIESKFKAEKTKSR